MRGSGRCGDGEGCGAACGAVGHGDSRAWGADRKVYAALVGPLVAAQVRVTVPEYAVLDETVTVEVAVAPCAMAAGVVAARV